MQCDPALVARSRELIALARAVVVSAGAGMGVDSGLPDFRGASGFWRAYPIFRELGLSFADLAQPRWFRDDPHLAWGFYGHRLASYRAATPHLGFGTLLGWMRDKPGGGFVFTSNVDGQFQRAGFPPDALVECHGSIHHLQCTRACGSGIVPAGALQVEVDLRTMRAREPLPACAACGALVRPNVLMFGDGEWDAARTAAQQARLGTFLSRSAPGDLVVVELGAGRAVPTVRRFGDALAARGAALVRINPRDPEVAESRRAVGLPLGAREALRRIAEDPTAPRGAAPA